MKNPKRSQTTNHRRHNRRKQDRDRMDVAFVENSQDHVHREDGQEQDRRQSTKELTKDQRFTLKGRLHARILALDLTEGIFDKLCRITNRHAGKQVKIDRNAAELIEMVHRLW